MPRSWSPAGFRARVCYLPDRILIAPSWILRIVTFGIWSRTIDIHRSERTVTLSTRFAWKSQQRQVSFDDLIAITYGYVDDAPPLGWSIRFQPRYQWDNFQVGLRLQNQSSLRLINFTGSTLFDGAPLVFQHAHNWLHYGGSEHTPAVASQALVDTLRRWTRLPLVAAID